MEFTAKSIADFLNGALDGDPEVKVNTVARIEEGKPGSLAFLANPKYTKYLYTTGASIVLVNADFEPEQPVRCTLIRVPNAYDSFAKLLELAGQARPRKTGVHPRAVVEESATLGSQVYVGAMAYVGENVSIGNHVSIYPHAYIGDNVSIGPGTIVHSGAHIHADCTIGSQCIIHSGAVIGADGFGFAPQPDGSYHKIPQVGNVTLGDHVEVGANTTIDRATLGSTVIGRGVKLDNLIQIAHNVEVGEDTVIAAQAGVAGSTKLGKGCMVGGQVGIVGHITIANGVKILAQSGIPNSVKTAGQTIIGSPPYEVKQYFKLLVHIKQLPDLKRRIDEMEHRLTLINPKP